MRSGRWVVVWCFAGCTFGTAGVGGSAGLGEGAEDTGTGGDEGPAGGTLAMTTTGVDGTTGSEGPGDGDDDDDDDDDDDELDTGTGTDGGTTGVDADDDDDDDDQEPICGDRILDAGEDCDDANEDETDGCLSTCAVPRSCQHIANELEDPPDGAYEIVVDEVGLTVYCDMTTAGGGWTLVAKVNPATMNGTPESEPLGWFGMVLEADALASPMLVIDAPLESQGASRLSPLLEAGSLARFELVAADEPTVTEDWYKRVASPASFEEWFGDDPTSSEVCQDVDMTMGCSMGTIEGTGSATPLVGMDLADYGYDTSWWIHMRLENNSGTNNQGICSDTLDNQSNAWPDSYNQHWGNALRIWLRE